MNLQDELAKTLKNNGHSLTKTRQALFSSLLSGKPRSMQELSLDLASVMDRASIYRTISLFEALGIVTRVQHGWKYKIELSDRFSPHHHHILCTKCGKMDNFDEPLKLEAIMNEIGRQHNYQVTGHALELEGICKSCSG